MLSWFQKTVSNRDSDQYMVLYQKPRTPATAIAKERTLSPDLLSIANYKRQVIRLGPCDPRWRVSGRHALGASLARGLRQAPRYSTALQREGAMPALLRSRSSGRLGTS